MTTATATLHPATPTAPSAQPSLMAVGEALARVSDLVVELDPRDRVWRDAGPHVTAVVAAVRHALDGSGSPIAVDDEVSPMLRLRDLACTAQRSAGSPDVVIPAEPVSRHLAALVQAVVR